MSARYRQRMDIEYLRQAVDYDEETGVMEWKSRPRHHFKTDKGYRLWQTRFAGAPPGTLDAKGYLRIPISGVVYRAHRLAWLLAYGEEAKGQIDHINGVPADNRLVNLRVVTASCNSRNTKLRADNKSGHPGVSWRKDLGRWAALIGIGSGSNKTLGFFDTKAEAVAARRGAEIVLEYHPNHGRCERP